MYQKIYLTHKNKKYLQKLKLKAQKGKKSKK